MRYKRSILRLLVVAVAIALFATACGSSSKKSGGSTSGGSKATDNGPVPQGGTLTVGAEQEPDCMDWISSCGGSSWGYWMAQVQTVPFAFIASGNGGEVHVGDLRDRETEPYTQPLHPRTQKPARQRIRQRQVDPQAQERKVFVEIINEHAFQECVKDLAADGKTLERG